MKIEKIIYKKNNFNKKNNMINKILKFKNKKILKNNIIIIYGNNKKIFIKKILKKILKKNIKIIMINFNILNKKYYYNKYTKNEIKIINNFYYYMKKNYIKDVNSFFKKFEFILINGESYFKYIKLNKKEIYMVETNPLGISEIQHLIDKISNTSNIKKSCLYIIVESIHKYNINKEIVQEIIKEKTCYKNINIIKEKDFYKKL